MFLCVLILMFASGPAGIVSDADEVLKIFRRLEEAGKLQYAKAHPEEYDSFVQIYLERFDNSKEFAQHVEELKGKMEASTISNIGPGIWLAIFVECARVVCIFCLRIIKKFISSLMRP